jgi:hypothetical protein
MPQKIVIFHKHSRYTGVSSWVYTVSYWLCKVLGHEVHVVIPEQSNSKYCAMLKKAVKGNLHLYWAGPADVFIFNYASDAVMNLSWNGYKIFVVHGLMYADYIPPNGMDKVICQSKRAFDFIKTKALKTLINQPIDLDRFRSYKPINEELQKVLILDSRSNSFYIDKVMAACGQLGIFVQSLGESNYGDNSTFAVETVINKADLVIGYGRSIYEAMGCGRAVMVYGINGGDGYLTADNFEINYESNCSGWNMKAMANPKNIEVSQIVDQLKSYQQSHGQHNRELAKRFSVLDNVKELVL